MYFNECGTLEELKKLYRKLVIENHPDRGGSVEAMQKINDEYEKMLKRLGNAYNFSHCDSDETYDWSKDRFAEIIQKIVGFDKMNIEIIGTWIWCFNSFEYKEQLKDLGFWFSGSKKAWVYSGEEKKRVRGRNKLSEIRAKYGSSTIKTSKILNLD